MRRLRSSVVSGGKVYPAGAELTDEQAAKITADVFEKGYQPDSGQDGETPGPSETEIQLEQTQATLAARESDLAALQRAASEHGDSIAALTVQLSEADEQVADLERALAEARAASTRVVEDYSALQVADLESRVEQRNEGRDDDHKIVVKGKGNKPDLVAALQSDDARTAGA